jgi:hypothetical protein
MIWRLSNRYGHKISGLSERMPLPISEALNKIRFAFTKILLGPNFYSSKEEVFDARQSH